MPVRVTCALGIGGRLAGPPETNHAILVQLQRLLPKDAPAGVSGGWPGGLATHGWRITSWHSAAEVGGEGDQETRLTFRCELSILLNGTIYDARDELTYTLFHGFAHYRDAVWHKDLKVRLEELNHEIVQGYGAEKLIEKIWFRHWEFSCGNGGDH
jgi:hypothetical protein